MSPPPPPARLLLLLAAAALPALPLLRAQGDGACSSLGSCRACLASPHCHWCSSNVMGKSRCVHTNDTKNVNWCDGTPTLVETNHQIIRPGSDTSWILPEHVKVTLRVREEFKLNVTYRRLKDYPVDLYFLMDLSYSMLDDKDNLSRLGDKLAAVMKNITENFRLGFGSFVDKVAMPFVNTHPKKLEEPCPGCTKPYSFRNHMPLTNNTDLFAKEVEKSPVSGNIDHPEGGFDALMQAIVCTNEIKWRPHARHLLVMATDASFHIAGDGKLAGVVEPHDEKCHMKNGEYTHGLELDYPSIAQLNRQAVNKSITLIFAVTKEQETLYKTLSDHIQGSNFGTLSNDSSNVIELVQSVYEKLVESVEMNDDSANKGISVTYKAYCLQDSSHLKDTKTCDNIHARQNVTFQVTIQAPKCPPDAGEIWNETITIKPNGIDEEVKIDLQIHCGCSCEQKGNPGYEENSPSCKKHGDKKCGMCYCQDDFTGHMCECTKDQFTRKESIDGCISNATKLVCNERGACVCNVCKCSKRQDPEEEIYGPFCECDNFSCVRFDGEICSGKEKGLCDCGKCVCNPGWTGEDCSCRDSPHTCRASGNSELCSGAGECRCGSCSCNKGYSGQFCEDCMTCPGGLCKTVAKCVEYLAHKTVEYDRTFCEPKNITLVKTVKHIDDKERKGPEKFCREPDASGCSFVFTYEEIDDGFLIIAEEEKQCPAPVNLLGIVFGVIGGTVFIGIVTILIWKILTTIHDQREFAKFEKERAQSKWERGDNPLYVQATSTFSNPTFSGN